MPRPACSAEISAFARLRPGSPASPIFPESRFVSPAPGRHSLRVCFDVNLVTRAFVFIHGPCPFQFALYFPPHQSLTDLRERFSTLACYNQIVGTVAPDQTLPDNPGATLAALRSRKGELYLWLPKLKSKPTAATPKPPPDPPPTPAKPKSAKMPSVTDSAPAS